MVLRHINLHVYKQKLKCGNLQTIKNTFAKYFFTKLLKLLETYISRCVFGINHEKSNWEPSRRVSWIGYNIDTHTSFIFASDTRILESFALILMEFCASLEFSTCVHLKNIASIFGQTISMSRSCGNVTQVMTRYLHLITNSRSSWNSLV